MKGFLIYFAITLVPAFVSMAMVIGWRRMELRSVGRNPTDERLLRPPGEYLRLKLIEIEDQISEWLPLLFIVPTIGFSGAIAIYGSITAVPRSAWVGAGIVVITTLAIAMVHLLQLFRQRADFRLGFSGERAVAELLNRLTRHQLEVIHDVPAEKHGNIDHVVVGASTVWSIETKTRRKRRPKTGVKDHEVTYDGHKLIFPNGTDTEQLDQTRRQALWLKELLSKALAQPIEVRPVLVLPGWMVHRTGRGDVTVVNPKELEALLKHPIPVEARQRMQQIAFALESRCRDVEF